MEVLKYFTNLFKGRDNQLINVVLFSMSGISVICLAKVLSSLIGGWYGDFFGFGASDDFVIAFCFILAAMFDIYFYSYGFACANKFFKNEDEALADVSLSVYKMFIKILPLTLAWIIYLIVAAIIGLYIFNFGVWFSLIYFLILLFLLPSVSLVLISFAKSFKYSLDFFNPFKALKNVDKYLGRVLKLILKLFVIFFVVGFLIYLALSQSIKVYNVHWQLGLRIFILAIWYYFVNLTKLVYIKGVCEIIKND